MFVSNPVSGGVSSFALGSVWTSVDGAVLIGMTGEFRPFDDRTYPNKKRHVRPIAENKIPPATESVVGFMPHVTMV